MCSGLSGGRIVGAVAGSVGVLGCSAQTVAVRSAGRCSCSSSGVGVTGVAWCVSQTALDGELQQFVVT